MPQWGPFTKSGEGHAALSTVAVAATEISARLVTASKSVRFVGGMAPRGVWQVGEYGLGAFPGDPWNPAVAFVEFSKFMHHEFEDENLPTVLGGPPYYPSVWWRFLPTITVELIVYW